MPEKMVEASSEVGATVLPTHMVLGQWQDLDISPQDKDKTSSL